MSIKVTCACGKILKAPKSMLGKKARCPGCSNIVTIEETQVIAKLPVNLSPQELYERVKDTVVGIFYEGIAATGFSVNADGLIVTNRHVVGTQTDVVVALYKGKEIPGKVVRSFRDVDLAFIKVNEKTSRFAQLSKPGNIKVGQYVYAIGYPGGLSNTLTQGVISAIGRYIDKKHFIQTDAAINPGNSGGPLFNDVAEVIGVNTSILEQSQGIGFAIPVDILQNCIEQIAREDIFNKHYCGICGNCSESDMYCEMCGASLMREKVAAGSPFDIPVTAPVTKLESCPACKISIDELNTKYCPRCGTTLY
jgi:S1-C subfamily serine protease